MTYDAYSLMKISLPPKGLDLLLLIASNEGIQRSELKKKSGLSAPAFGSNIARLEDFDYVEVENRKNYRKQKFTLKEKAKKLLYERNPLRFCDPCQELNMLKEAKRYIHDAFVCNYHYELAIDDDSNVD